MLRHHRYVMGPYGVGIPRDSTCWRFPLRLYSEKPEELARTVHNAHLDRARFSSHREKPLDRYEPALRFQAILDRLHPTGFSRGGV